MNTLLRELYYPGQYFEVEMFNNNIFIVCYKKLPRGCAKFKFSCSYILELPLDNPSILYHNFKLVEFHNLYGQLEDNYSK